MTIDNSSAVLDTKTTGWQLFWLSCLLLFAEIMALRWMNIEFNTLKAFPNLIIMVILIATSGGLTWNESSLSNSSIFKGKILLCLSLAFMLLTLIAAPQLHIYEQSFRLDQGWNQITYSLIFFFLAIAALYIIFLKLGIALAPLFNALPSLTAYTLNLLGSIFGVLLFGIISYLSAPSFVWLLLCGLIVFAIRKRKSDLVIACLLACLAFGLNHKSYWSPYSKLDIVPVILKGDPIFVPGSYVLNANNAIFHFGVHVPTNSEIQKYVESKTILSGPLKRLIVSHLSFLEPPFLCVPQLRNVLVLGAGSGDDVAYALSKDVQHIDAVEIDPITCGFGRKKHPDYPYLNPRVTVYNEDARTFLRYTSNKYNLVEFAFLDPGNTIKVSSFLRVDNYVYTVESIKSALRCLSDHGVVSIAFASDTNYIIYRLYKTIMLASGSEPFAVVNHTTNSVLFLFGPGVNRSQLLSWLNDHTNFEQWSLPVEEAGIRPCTDQWPFLYTNFNYAGVWLYVGILTILVVLPSLIIFYGQKREAKFAELGNMFFLGLAFMLIETKSIIELSLLFGATWLVSSVVIAVILVLALLANLCVQKVKNIPLPYIYAALAGTLLLQFFLSVPERTDWTPAVIAGLACLVACLPIFFSGIIFSTCFRKAQQASASLAANLLGVAFGGLAENLSLIIGIKGLVIVAFFVYCLSAICLVTAKSNKFMLNNR